MFKSTLNQKGLFLISSFLVMSVVGTFSLALFLKSTTIYRTIEHSRNRITAFHLAESGVDRAIVELEANPNYIGQGYTVLGNGGFDVAVDSPNPADPTVRRIITNGHTPNNFRTSYAYENRQVVAFVNIQSGSGVPFAVFGDTEIRMSGRATTDSYDSRNGPYAPGGTNGDIGTNSVGRGDISLSGQARVNGDALVGTTGNPSSVISTSGQASISGTQSAATSATSMPSVQIPNNLVNRGQLSLSGGTTTLPGGTYWYESISVGSGGSLRFTGPATVYVSESVSISGSVSAANNLPPNLVVKVADDDGVSLSGGGTLYGAIYAPKSDVSLSGNVELFGGIMAKKVTMSGGGNDPLMLHYDEALSKVSGIGSEPKVLMRSWQES